MDRGMLRETRDQLAQFEERLLRLEAGRRQRQQQQTVSAGVMMPLRATLTLFHCAGARSARLRMFCAGSISLAKQMNFILYDVL